MFSNSLLVFTSSINSVAGVHNHAKASLIICPPEISSSPSCVKWDLQFTCRVHKCYWQTICYSIAKKDFAA